ncbi:unnamed protein product [Nesidiocoris tenuis]|uniref:Uncharacterized protein n=1 Tax=Nesidiocoris tenuis TaxID=355587 RepID=A0A6H5HAQ7_9HEMI|nr:unnamed protein product [Nesidiocoris tenuis]
MIRHNEIFRCHNHRKLFVLVHEYGSIASRLVRLSFLGTLSGLSCGVPSPKDGTSNVPSISSRSNFDYGPDVPSSIICGRVITRRNFVPNDCPIPLSGSKTSGSGTCSVPEQFETEQSVAPLVEPEATARPSGSGRIILSFDWLSDPTVTDVKKFRNLNFSPPCRTIVAVIETFNGLIISLVYNVKYNVNKLKPE